MITNEGMHRFSETIKTLNEEWDYLSYNFENPSEDIQERIKDIESSILDIISQIILDREDIIRKIEGFYDEDKLLVSYDSLQNKVTLMDSNQKIMCFYLDRL